MSSAIAVEARRQLENAQWSHDDLRQHLDEELEMLREDRSYDLMMSNFRSVSENLLVIGQGRFVLDGDAIGARQAFSELVQWSPLWDGFRASEKSGIESKPSLRLLLEPIVCLLLAGDEATIGNITEVNEEKLFLTAAEETKSIRPWVQFVSTLLAVVRTTETQAAVEARKPMALPADHIFAGYEGLLAAILEPNAELFEQRRAALEKAYAERRKRRDVALNWYGSGKLSQAVTFDALGTALCNLAVRKGLDVAIDSRLYPQYFIRS